MRANSFIVVILAACLAGMAAAQIPDIVPITVQEALGPLAEVPALEDSAPAVEVPPAVVGALPGTGPESEPVAEPVAEPESEPAVEPAAEPESEPVVEPESETPLEPATETTAPGAAVIPVIPLPSPVPVAEVPNLTAPSLDDVVPEVEADTPETEDLAGIVPEVIAPGLESALGPDTEFPLVNEELEGDFIYLEVASGGTPFEQVLYFLNSYRPIAQAFINAQRVERTSAVDPPGWNLTHYGEALDLSAPVRVDLYDAAGNKVFTPLPALTSRSLGTQFGVAPRGSAAGYYPAGSFPPLSPGPGA
ncbi:Zinc metalloprotease ZmpB [Auxenochlorella protothecoides]|uniref:Zinc metalloprotease ZmpB n=1 Tax=Auxenochlorella protothecoides TaxID=3075 RepID=A0A087SE20_AUXPR|nr:Zinc metalloprotease ZmpB [Auxenochlorella protothecoides]KFM23974.1 Zinc metalloprotease ZmpB [Auxenochlorella protothecoides]